ncbi:MAG: hypothetical protein M1814_001825 [Vezdaea aestivalis]|nr:MAG: hypothetical protein M1814_001825 [Vezdaea aestivalis]
MAETTGNMTEDGFDNTLHGLLASGSLPEGVGDIWSRPVDQRGKADNAKDFEDISDDDLPDEEDIQQDPGDKGLAREIEDDLFGDSGLYDDARNDDLFSEVQPREFDWAKARELNGLPPLHDQDYLPAPPENDEEVFAAMWPTFRQYEAPKFQQLFPPKPAQYVGKQPLKPPKPLNMNKVSLDLAHDQAKIFRVADLAAPSKFDFQLESGQRGLVPIVEEDIQSESDEESEDGDIDPNEMIGNVSWQDIEVACIDFDIKVIEDRFDAIEAEISRTAIAATEDDLFGDDWDLLDEPAAKRQKASHIPDDFFTRPAFNFKVLDDPERITAKNAEHIILDLNDPHLMVQVESPPLSTNKRTFTEMRDRDTKSNAISRRFNISNDEAYDQLKENHQSKVRSTLTTLAVEHTLPAVKLQYPFYKAELDTKEARSFHRPTIDFIPNHHILFERVDRKSSKAKKSKIKDIKTLYASSADLSMNDKADVVFLEYSEEYPTTLSNFGMGNRFVNYYRKKTADDTYRPRLNIGEPVVLFPQDRSPFSQFGSVDPGETVPTLHNSMYRAPIFDQKPKNTDFLVVRSETGVEGKSFSMRKVKNLYTVGQQFPLVDVPGPHARKVTTAQKNRMKMIAFRLANKDKYQTVDMPDVTKHIRDSTDLQNRQKMKEFMKYNKDYKRWGMKPEEIIPDELGIRSMVKPEDVCLIESMQVGKRHLQDTGYGKDVEELEDEEAKEGESLEKQMSPWSTTRNFLLATQGKAMLQLHGEGDPSGRGEAFSFLKTSMKGGFKALGESIEDRIEAKKQEVDSGHKYNVAKQAKAYDETIRRIWQAQKSSLSSQVENSDIDLDDMDVDEPEEELDFGRTPRSEAHNPFNNVMESETGSQMSRASTLSQHGKVLRIHGRKRHPNGQYEDFVEVVRNPAVIKMYIKKRTALEMDKTDVRQIKPTGDAEQDKRAQKRLLDELARLERNKDRRIAREKQKGIVNDDNPESPASPGSPSVTPAVKAPTGTTRKCANCGQVGHIKTNKKLCPMLNGTMDSTGSGFTAGGFGSMATTPALATTPAPPGTPALVTTPAPATTPL